MIMAATTKKAPMTLEIPTEEIQKLAESVETVLIRVRRRNDKGQFSTLYTGVRFPTEELVAIDSWCQRNAGGGRFRIEVHHVDRPAERAMASFEFLLEGRPLPRRDLGAPAPQDPAGFGPPPPQGPMYAGPQYPQQHPGGMFTAPSEVGSAWAQGLADPRARQAFGVVDQPPAGDPFVARGWPAQRRGARNLPPGATMASDELAIKQVAKLERELAAARAESKAAIERAEAQAARAREEAQRQREKATEERHAAQLAALEAKIDAARTQPESKNSMAETVTMLAPFVPVFQSLITAKSSESGKVLETQMQGVNTLMQATLSQGQKTDVVDTLTKVAPLLMPLLARFFDQRAPEQQAALYQAMSEQNLNSVAMMAQLIEAMTPEGADEQPWYPMISETLKGIVNMSAAYVGAPGGLPGQQPAPLPSSGQLSQNQSNPSQDAGVSTYGAPPQADADVASDVNPQLDAMFALLPQAFQTREWRRVLQELHIEPLNVEVVSVALTNLLEHLINFDMLPAELAAIQTQPRETLIGVVQYLPVAQSNGQGLSDVIETTIGLLMEDGFLQAPQVVETSGHEAAPEAVQQTS